MKKIVVINCSIPQTDQEQSFRNGGLLITQAIQKYTPCVQMVDMGDDSSSFPLASTVAGVILSGSDKMVTEEDPARQHLESYIRGIAEEKIPILGICYGHQFLAQLFGGEVGYNPKGIEVGSAVVYCQPEAHNDPLFFSIGEQLSCYVVHAQSVMKLPPRAKPLASNHHDPHHAFCLDDHIWGVQFHPEFHYQTMKKYTYGVSSHYQEDPDQLIQRITPYNEAVVVLENFVSIVQKAL